MESINDPRRLFEVERHAEHAVRPGFRIGIAIAWIAVSWWTDWRWRRK